jgi:hypothetical protein
MVSVGVGVGVAMGLAKEVAKGVGPNSGFYQSAQFMHDLTIG